METRLNSRARAMRRYALLFLGPIFAAFAVCFIWPFLRGLWLSFCEFRLIKDARFVGLRNFAKAFADISFRHSFLITAAFALVSALVVNVLAFIVAYVLTQGIHGSNLFRAVFFMPNLIGGIVLGYIWSMIFDGILRNFNASILLDGNLGFWGLVIVVAWQQIGYMMIIYIAGLQSVPDDIIEAAKIDGAGKMRTLFHVTIPNVMASFTICLFLTLTNSFKLFDQNLALTAGQPITILADGSSIKTTEMLALNIYNTFYSSNTSYQGVAQAKAVIFTVLVSAIGLIQLYCTRKREVQR